MCTFDVSCPSCSVPWHDWPQPSPCRCLMSLAWILLMSILCCPQNKGSDASCAMCTTKKPAQAAAPSAAAPSDSKDDAPHPQSFNLYHFNGINGGKDKARCSRIHVQLLGDGLGQQGDSGKQGLREVILTRWSGSLVEYVGAEPRII